MPHALHVLDVGAKNMAALSNEVQIVPAKKPTGKYINIIYEVFNAEGRNTCRIFGDFSVTDTHASVFHNIIMSGCGVTNPR